jgi:hypothetical protein
MINKSITSILKNDIRSYDMFSLVDYMKKENKRTYQNTLLLVVSLTNQLQYLINIENVTFYEYRTNNIFVFLKKQKEKEKEKQKEKEKEKEEYPYFFHISNDFMKINEKQKIKFSKPFDREDCFISPEIINMNQLPTEIHYKTIYYSLGCVAIFFLSGQTLMKEEEASTLLK